MPPVTNTYNVQTIIKSDAALTPNAGDKLFEVIDSAIVKKLYVVVDFGSINYITSAFLNAAIGQLYSKYSSDELNEHLKLENLADDDRVLLKKVIDRAKQYFGDKQRFEDDYNSHIDKL